MVKWKNIVFDYDLFRPAMASDSEREYWIKEFKTERAVALNASSKLFNINCVVRGEGEELVVCMVVGKGMKYFIPAIKQRAKEKGFKSFIFHIQNDAVMRLYRESLKNEKVSKVETVYRVLI